MKQEKLLAALLVAAFAGAAAAVSGGAGPVSVSVSVDDSKYRFYEAENTVGFPTVMRGGEPAKYSNASYREFARWETSEKGVEKVRSTLEQRFGGINGVSSGTTADGIELSYVANESIERNFTFQELVAASPSRVEGTVSYPGETVEVSVPVEVRKVSADQQAYALDAAKAGADASFGSSGGPRYNASFEVVETITGNHTGNRLENVSISRKHVEFTGYVKVADPCVELHRSFEEKENRLVMNVSTSSGSGFCTQVVAMKKYRFSLESTDSILLEVVHSGEKVRTISTRVSHPDGEKMEQPFYGFLFDIAEIIGSLLG
ncbi:MAG: hypothetical protein ABEK00_03425 [Candidatus Nanohaloarchaea archaeon]